MKFDVGFGVQFQPSLDEEIEAVARPALGIVSAAREVDAGAVASCADTVGGDRRQRAHDGVHHPDRDLCHTAEAGGGRSRIEEAAPRHDNIDRPEAAIVEGHVRSQQLKYGVERRGQRVAIGGIHRPFGLWAGAGEIDHHPVAVHCDGHRDPPGLVRHAVVIDKFRETVAPGWKIADHQPRQFLGVILYILHRRMDGIRTISPGQPQQPPLGGLRARQLCLEIAPLVTREADVERDELDDVAVLLALMEPADRRNAQSLLEHAARRAREAGDGHAADVKVMGAVHGIPKETGVREDRADEGNVGQMAAAAIGVVHEVHVTWKNILRTEKQDDEFDR